MSDSHDHNLMTPPAPPGKAGTCLPMLDTAVLAALFLAKATPGAESINAESIFSFFAFRLFPIDSPAFLVLLAMGLLSALYVSARLQKKLRFLPHADLDILLREKRKFKKSENAEARADHARNDRRPPLHDVSLRDLTICTWITNPKTHVGFRFFSLSILVECLALFLATQGSALSLLFYPVSIVCRIMGLIRAIQGGIATARL